MGHFMKYSPWIALAILASPFVAEFLFWCFCWCFCKVEGYFQERFMQKILKNMDRLDQIALASEKNTDAA